MKSSKRDASRNPAKSNSQIAKGKHQLRLGFLSCFLNGHIQVDSTGLNSTPNKLMARSSLVYYARMKDHTATVALLLYTGLNINFRVRIR